MSNNNICIMVDSGSDMLPEEARELGLVLIPLSVRFGDEEFFDGETITRDEFYTRMETSSELPKTSLIPPARYEELFQAEVDAGNEVICLTLSAKISGCYQSALIAADEFEGKVHVIDTKQFCGPEYLLAKRAAELRDLGLSAAEIVNAITRERDEVRVIALFDTLEYLKKGGRISSVAAGIGGALSIKPVLTITNGEVDIIGKARGSKNGNNMLVKFVRELGGIDWDRSILLSWSGTSKKLLDKYVTDSSALYEGKTAEELPTARVGSVIGTYTGPGAIALNAI